MKTVFKDENGKTSSTRVPLVLLSVLLMAMIVSDVFLGFDTVTEAYDALVAIILGLTGSTGVRGIAHHIRNRPLAANVFETYEDLDVSSPAGFGPVEYDEDEYEEGGAWV